MLLTKLAVLIKALCYCWGCVTDDEEEYELVCRRMLTYADACRGCVTDDEEEYELVC